MTMKSKPRAAQKQAPESLDPWQRLKALSETGQLPKGGKSREMDGRRLRATGRTVQFNLKVKPDFRDEIFALAAERGIGMAAMLEIILQEWKAKAGARR
ncbi:MAG: hypothetical protein RLZ98_2061 [Pseudomonadota bacterium]|jgi:hypothetical protein